MTTTHIIGGHRVSDSVLGAVRDASRRTGADFDYMMAKAAQESGFRADARASTSSATGLYQFIETTWLGMVREHGARHGLGNLARQIGVGPEGNPTVTDPATRDRILDLRRDPRLNAVMAGEFANDNKAHLERAVGGEIGATELYLAHFLGADGAEGFLTGLRASPEQPAADLFPAAARANRAVFFDDAGAPRSLRAIHARFGRSMDEAMALSDQTADARSVPASNDPRTAVDTAAPVSGARPGWAAGRDSVSLWTLLYLNALPVPGE